MVENMQDYETGYREGESNAHADWDFALSEYGNLPDGFEITPMNVARLLSSVLIEIV